MNVDRQIAPRLSVARIVEAVITASIIGGMIMWGNNIGIGKDIEHIKQDQKEIKEWYKETRTEVDGLTKLVYEHKH